jgi:RND family efflux transporter MFP subunit
MTSRMQPLAFVALSLACVGLVGCKPAATRAEPPPPKVMVQQPVQRDLIDYDQYHGWLDAVASVDVRARVRGHIQKVAFGDGQMVKAGDLLFEIDPRPLVAEAERSKQQLRIYKAQLTRAVSEEARLKDLYKKGGAADKEVETAVAATESLRAQIDAQTQEIALKDLDVEYARVTAAIGGRLSRAMLTEGNLVNAGGAEQVLTTIAAIDPVHLYFYVDERSLQRYMKSRAATQPRARGVKELQIPMTFALETDEGFPNAGYIDYTDNRIDATTGTILVRGSVPNPNGRLLPGSSVRVRIPVSDAQSVTTVPDVAVLSDQDRKYLLVIDAKNVVQRRDVRLGKLLDDGMRIILPAGGNAPQLRADDWLITDGLQSARVNYAADPVRPATQPAKVAHAAQGASSAGQDMAAGNHGGDR